MQGFQHRLTDSGWVQGSWSKYDRWAKWAERRTWADRCLFNTIVGPEVESLKAQLNYKGVLVEQKNTDSEFVGFDPHSPKKTECEEIHHFILDPLSSPNTLQGAGSWGGPGSCWQAFSSQRLSSKAQVKGMWSACGKQAVENSRRVPQQLLLFEKQPKPIPIKGLHVEQRHISSILPRWELLWNKFQVFAVELKSLRVKTVTSIMNLINRKKTELFSSRN